MNIFNFHIMSMRCVKICEQEQNLFKCMPGFISKDNVYFVDTCIYEHFIKSCLSAIFVLNVFNPQTHSKLHLCHTIREANIKILQLEIAQK